MVSGTGALTYAVSVCMEYSLTMYDLIVAMAITNMNASVI